MVINYYVVWSCQWKLTVVLSISYLKEFNTEWCYYFDLDEQYAAFFNHCDQAYKVVWFWSLWFDFYTAYKVFLLTNATTSTLKNNRVLSFMTVIKLYNPWAYGSVSILPTRFFYEVMLQLWPLTLKNNRVLPLMMVIKYTKLYDSGAYYSVSILSTRFIY
jgi:hypothetical protein